MAYKVYKVKRENSHLLDELKKIEEELEEVKNNKEKRQLEKRKKELEKQNKTKSNIFQFESEIKNVLEFNWQDDITKTFLSFDFTTTTELECGDWIELFDEDSDEFVFFGIITKATQQNINTYKYFGYDYGFYLEKNNITIQFETKQSLSQAIVSACERANIETGKIPIIDTKAKGIYKKTKISDILFKLYEDVIDENLSEDFYFDCKNGKVNLYPFEYYEKISGYIANIYAVDSFRYILNYEKTNSIEDLKNKVEVWQAVQDADKLGDNYDKDRYTDKKSIEKYGLLIHTEEIKDSERSKIDDIANKKLDELNIVKTEMSFNVIADYNLKIGVVVKIDNDNLKIHGRYKVISTKHSIKETTENVHVNVIEYKKPIRIS